MSGYLVYMKKESGRQYEEMLHQQFYGQIDGRLRAVFFELDDWIHREFGKRLIITCLNRTKEENKVVGGVEWSAHLFGRAIDGRTHIFTREEITKITNHLTDVWGDFIYAKYHNAGTGNHLHINITYKYIRKNFGQLKLR